MPVQLQIPQQLLLKPQLHLNNRLNLQHQKVQIRAGSINSNNPVENNGAGGHSPQADPNATPSSSETTPNGRAWVLVYVDKAGNKHESTVSTSYKELQDKANALLASGEATSYYFIQK
ncbi:hypothetical protein [Lactococcus petauri]|uniref:hypothetical protein n=1 Tax=Lactococcus petauri TaxID=1940789 RepID=UPI003852CCDA